MRVTLVLIFQLILLLSGWTQSSLHSIFPPIGDFQGKVLDEHSIPLPFASVKLYKDGEEFAETLSDFDGNFQFESILAGEYLLEIYPPFNCSGIKISKSIFIRVNEVLAETFIFGEPASISGVVRDETGEAIPFANVVLYQNGNQRLGTTTDFDGKYKFKQVILGTYDLRISFVGFITGIDENIEVTGSNLELDFLLIKDPDTIEVLYCGHHYYNYFHKDETTTGHTFTRQEIQRMANF